MAQVDVKWPSEDEDFDATTNSGGTQQATLEPKKETSVEEPDTNNDTNNVDENKAEEPSLAPELSNEPEASDESHEESHDESHEESHDEGSSDKETDTHSDEEVKAEAKEAEVSKPVSETVEPEIAPPAHVITDPGGPVASSKTRRPFGHYLVEIVLLVTLVAVGLMAKGLSADKTDLQKQVTKLNANPAIVAQKETESLLNKVGKLISLPTGETPTIANVSDATQAKKQSAFFKDAQNGDRVLLYPKAGQAILYRPSTDKIILQAPLTFTNNAATTTGTTNTKATTTKTTTGTTR